MSTGPLPAITSISTSEAAFGSTITVDGQNFGSSQDTLTVGGSSDGVDIQSWSDTRIIFVLLDPASSGRVTVTTDHSTSHEGIDLRVTSPHFTFDSIGGAPTVVQGNPLRIVTTCNFKNGFANVVTPTVVDDPTGTGTFNPTTITGSGGSLYSLDTSTLPPGSYTLTIRASADGRADREHTFTFKVALVDSLPLQSFGIPVTGPSFDVTSQGSFSLNGTPLDAAGNPLPTEGAVITSSNPSVVRAIEVSNFFFGDETRLFAIANGSSTLTFSYPDGFSRTIDVNVDFPTTARITAIGISPPVVSNAGTDVVTVNAAATGIISISYTGDLSIENWDTNWFDSNRSLVSTFEVSPQQRPGTFLFQANTAGFGGETASLPATLTVVNGSGSGRISGEIFKAAADDFPDTSGTIELYPAGGDGTTPGLSGFINAMGRATFDLAGIAPGDYKLRFNNASQAVASSWYPNALNFAAAATLTIAPSTHLQNVLLFLPPSPVCDHRTPHRPTHHS